MKFATDICPLCGEQLKTRVGAGGRNAFICPEGEKAFEFSSESLMPLGHSYEVFQVDDNFWRQDSNVPPFALDSDCVVIDGKEEYFTTLYIWNDERKVPEYPGWTEVGVYPYIKLKKLETLISKLQLLLPFA